MKLISSILFLILSCNCIGQNDSAAIISCFPTPLFSAQTQNENNSPEEITLLSPIETEAQFQGGNEALFTFLKDNIYYPKDALQNGFQGKVYVQFVIDTTGDITDITIIKVAHKSLDEEAKRVIAMMPCWTPAIIGNKTVSVRFTLPITFTLN